VTQYTGHLKQEISFLTFGWIIYACKGREWKELGLGASTRKISRA
jgi:hypothetical protein